MAIINTAPDASGHCEVASPVRLPGVGDITELISGQVGSTRQASGQRGEAAKPKFAPNS